MYIERNFYFANIEANQLLNELLFPAIRYCIGSVSNAFEYAQIIEENRTKFPKNKLSLLARDIRVNTSLALEGHLDNIEVTRAYNHNIVASAHRLISEYLEPTRWDFRTLKYSVDCQDGRLTTSKIPMIETYGSIFDYIEPFEKLADMIDEKYVMVRVEYNGKSEWRRCLPCYEYDVRTGTFEKLYSKCPDSNTYIPKEYIKEERKWNGANSDSSINKEFNTI